MSWYGTHGAITKAQAKELAPPRACKWCIYRLRVFIDSRYQRPTDSKPCAACGALINFPVLHIKAVEKGWLYSKDKAVPYCPYCGKAEIAYSLTASPSSLKCKCLACEKTWFKVTR